MRQGQSLVATAEGVELEREWEQPCCVIVHPIPPAERHHQSLCVRTTACQCFERDRGCHQQPFQMLPPFGHMPILPRAGSASCPNFYPYAIAAVLLLLLASRALVHEHAIEKRAHAGTTPRFSCYICVYTFRRNRRGSPAVSVLSTCCSSPVA